MKSLWALLLISILFSFPAFGQYVAQDPTRYIPNARVLGLGKAFIGLCDDTGAMYTNPAGMAEAPVWQIHSMSGKFLDEYNYLSFSGFYPTEFGVLGFGFAGTSIAGAWATTIESGSDPSDPLYTIDTSQNQMGNYNNAFIVAYANQLNQVDLLKKISFEDRLLLGTNLKIFRTSIYGDGIQGGDASGYEMDLGAKAYPRDWMSLGLTFQNILFGGLGGTLRYASGHEETYPMVLEIGSAINILGPRGSLYKYGLNELKLLLDLNTQPTLKNYPYLWHAGVEWKPLSNVALRLGIDQDTAGDGKGGLTTVSDLAYGVGLSYGSFRFDYAYHTFAGAPNIDNHFFSLSYGFNPPPRVIEDKVLVGEPEDKSVTLSENVRVAGTVVDPDARKLAISGNVIKFGLKGEFESAVDLRIGMNVLTFEVYDKYNRIMQTKKVRILRAYTYPDVPAAYWAAKPIALLAMADLVTGYPDGTFRPEGSINRAEMCALLIKAKGEEPASPPSAKFNDVPSGHWAEGYISQAAESGIVKGYAGNLFKPYAKISRVEGLAMIARFAGLAEEKYKNEFNDIPPSHWAATMVAGAYKAGVLDFLKGKRFEPTQPLTRAEAVEMLSRTKYVQELLKKDLLNWEGY